VRWAIGLAIGVLGSTAVPVSATAPVVATTAHVALVVGNNRGDPDEVPLRFAVADARRVAEVLLDAAGADVRLLEGPTPQQIEQALADTRRKVARWRQAGRQVVVSVYYAGHADKEQLHLAGKRYPLRGLRQQLRGMGARVSMLVTDACRADAGIRKRGLERLDVPDIAATVMVQPSGFVWIHATSAGQAAQESDRLRGGVFTHFWVSALRGAADTDSDGRITLAEAYTYAARHTHGYSAASRVGPQWPAYDYRLSGARDLVLTQTAAAPSRITLPAGRDTLYVLRRWPSGATVLQVSAKPTKPVEVALPAGRFQVIRRASGSVSETRVHLPWGGRKALAARDFSSASPPALTARGASAQPQAWAHLAGGISLEPDLPLTWQRLEVLVALRLAGAYNRWLLAASLGWQGHAFDLVQEERRVRSDSLMLAFAGAACFDLGPAVLFVGPRARLELQFQRESAANAARHDAAELPSFPRRTTVRLAGLVDVGISLPLVADLSWVMRLAGGAALQPAGDQAAAIKPLVEVATGPAWIW
jgi:hypothetical protein